MNAITATVPSQEYLSIFYVALTATDIGKNSQIQMENLGDGTFRVTDGRTSVSVGAKKPKSYILPMSEWDSFYRNKLSTMNLPHSAVEVYTTKRKKVVQTIGVKPENDQYAREADPSVDEIVRRILQYADMAMEESFTIKADEITPEMIKRGCVWIKQLNSIYTEYELLDSEKKADKALTKSYVSKFNDALIGLYAAVPRRIVRLNDMLAKQPKNFLNLITDNQDLIDLAEQQATGTAVVQAYSWTKANGITCRPATESEKAYIVKKLTGNGCNFIQAWIFDNKKTRSNYNEFCEKHNLSRENKGCTRLWHGTRVMNLCSILTNGLVLDPERFGASLCGKAYGYGTYFAPDARKSLGYTSIQASKWANGNQPTGLLLLYDVAVGQKETQYNGSCGCDHTLCWNKLQRIKPGAFCTWAEYRYSGFMMDEVIVYNECQDTVWAMVEVAR